MKAKPSVLLFFLTLILTLVMLVLGASAVDALTVYPIDRAQILAGSRASTSRSSSTGSSNRPTRSEALGLGTDTS
jgi:hypothetical protein